MIVRVFISVALALVTLVLCVLLLPVVLVQIGADMRGDVELEAKCGRIFDAVIGWVDRP